MNAEAEKQNIRGVIDAWIAASKRSDFAALADLMTEDVVFLQPGQEPMRGRETFLARARAAEQKMRLLEGKPQVQEIHLAGEYAICWNQLEIKVAAPEQPAHRLAGHVLSVFRQGADGRWRLFRDANLLLPVK